MLFHIKVLAIFVTQRKLLKYEFLFSLTIYVCKMDKIRRASLRTHCFLVLKERFEHSVKLGK